MALEDFAVEALDKVAKNVPLTYCALLVVRNVLDIPPILGAVV
jgi:hypothetical protein